MSPDLNPFEMLWEELKSAIGERKPANELEHIAIKVWERIPPEKCKKLINGYKNCLEAFVAAKRCKEGCQYYCVCWFSALFFGIKLFMLK